MACSGGRVVGTIPRLESMPQEPPATSKHRQRILPQLYLPVAGAAFLVNRELTSRHASSFCTFHRPLAGRDSNKTWVRPVVWNAADLSAGNTQNAALTVILRESASHCSFFATRLSRKVFAGVAFRRHGPCCVVELLHPTARVNVLRTACRATPSAGM